MLARRQSWGFSLIEVIIAAGIFAGSVTVVIALMAVLSRQASETTESLVASQLSDAVKVELVRLAASGFDQLAGQVPTLSASQGEGLALAASREGTQVQSLNYSPPATARIADSEQFYRVDCWKFQDEPLRYDSAKAFLALHVRISWPYRLPGTSTPVSLADRSQLTFVVSINR